MSQPTKKHVADSPAHADGQAISPYYFDRDTVISSSVNGVPISKFGDLEWKFRYSDKDSALETLRFHFGENDFDSLLHEQNKALIWCHMDRGRLRSRVTIRNSNYAVRAWCKIAASDKIDLFALLSDPEAVSVGSKRLNRNYLDLTPSLIGTLAKNRDVLQADRSVPLLALKKSIAEESASREDSKQTPLIPSRVYLAILHGLTSCSDKLEKELDVLVGRYLESTRTDEGEQGVDVDGVPMSVLARISYFQTALMHTVVAFSGMRKSEAGTLPLDGSLNQFEDGGQIHYEIRGFTSKLNGGIPKATSWITSREGAMAVNLARRIAEAVWIKNGRLKSSRQSALLFPSLKNSHKSKSHGSLDRNQKILIANISPQIEEFDIEELNRLELDRGWQRENIEIGLLWPLAFHQLRRSLSVYAHRSGMVSLPGLKAQLQHITDEMRAYYSNGFSRAVNLVFESDHFSHEWDAAKAESSFFGYTLTNLLEGADLFGRGVGRMASSLSNMSRSQTLNLFEKGLLAYRETPLGGCVSVEPCKSSPLQPLPMECVEKDCANLVIVGKRLESIIKSQEVVLAHLQHDRGSVEYRLEASHLRSLLARRDYLKAQ